MWTFECFSANHLLFERFTVRAERFSAFEGIFRPAGASLNDFPRVAPLLIVSPYD